MAILGATTLDSGFHDPASVGKGQLNRLISTEAGTITNIDGWLNTQSGTPTAEQFRFVIYRGTFATTLIYESPTLSHAVGGSAVISHTLTSGVAITATDTLWAGIISVTSDSRLTYTDETGGSVCDAVGAGIPAPASIDGSYFADYRYNSWLTYTPSGGGSITIGSTPTNNRVTESRTIRVTSPTTTITTGNTTIKINGSGNAAITPSSVTVVSGLTVDIAYTVPDTYAGLPYSAVGYPIIVTSTDGTVSSANVPFLPVTGNDFVVAASVPGDFPVFSGSLEVLDQLEYETIGGDVSVNPSLAVTYDGVDPTGLSFEARAWDDSDDTWGAFASISISDALAKPKNLWRNFNNSFLSTIDFIAFPDSAVSTIVNEFWEAEEGSNVGSFATTAGSVANFIGSQRNIGSFSASSGATSSLTGTQRISGSISVTAGAISNIVGSSANFASFSTTAGATANITGQQINVGSLSTTASAASSITGTQINQGAVSATGQATSVISGAQRNIGSISASGSAQSSISGTQKITGSISTTAGATSNIYETVVNSASFAATAGATSSIAGTQRNTGSVSASASAQSSVTGSQKNLGAFGTFAGAISDFQGSQVNQGHITVLNASPIAQIDGTQKITGTFSTVAGAIANITDFSYIPPTEFFANCIVRVQPDIIVTTDRQPYVRLKRDPIVQVKYGL